MALKTIVKISNVTNLSDARYCAGMGVDMLGFSMDESSPEYIHPATFAEIRSWVAGVQIVGETTATDIDQIERLLDSYQPDVLQVNEAALLPYLTSVNKPLIVQIDFAQFTLEQINTLLTVKPVGADFLLLESHTPIHIDDELKRILQNLASQFPVLLGIGITANTVHTLLSDIPVQGIALAGGNEEQPGNKEFGELMDILETLEVD